MRRLKGFIILLVGICWWAWVPMILGKWNHDSDYPAWIRNAAYDLIYGNRLQ
jgi:hypothetical protein